MFGRLGAANLDQAYLDCVAANVSSPFFNPATCQNLAKQVQSQTGGDFHFGDPAHPFTGTVSQASFVGAGAPGKGSAGGGPSSSPLGFLFKPGTLMLLAGAGLVYWFFIRRKTS